MRDDEWIKMNTNTPSQVRGSIPVVVVTIIAAIVMVILMVLVVRGL